MPPKRKRQQQQADEPRRPAPSASSDEENQSDRDTADDAPPFFNVSFSTHRASPLFIGEESLSPRRLDTIAQRLRDTLVGDVVRGVQVGLEGDNTSLGRAGSLERVTIRWFDAADLIGEDRKGKGRRSERESKRALCFEMTYENALCTALLLPRTIGSEAGGDSRGIQGPFQARDSLGMPATFDEPMGDADSQFLHLPLLLTRMPTQLKAFVIDFICRTFDCRIGPLGLGTRSLVAAWEGWVEDVGSPSRGPLSKELVLTLAFHLPPAVDPAGVETGDSQKAGLRSLDVIIPAEDIGRFARSESTPDAAMGGADKDWEKDPRMRHVLSGGSAEEGWGWLQPSSTDAAAPELPFTRAVATYLWNHLALNLFHPSVQIARIACGGFVLAENRLKVFALTSKDDDHLVATAAVRRLVSGLVDRAA